MGPHPVVVSLPLPPRELSPNGRFHHLAKARAVKAYRGSSLLLIRQSRAKAGNPVFGHVVIDYEFYLAPARAGIDDGLYRPRDVDNAIGAMKAFQDALRDAGLIANDSKRHVHIGDVRLYSNAKEHHGRHAVVATITEVCTHENN